MVCTNCNNQVRAVRKYLLKIHTSDDERKDLKMALCETCATEFLSHDWIEQQEAMAAND